MNGAVPAVVLRGNHAFTSRVLLEELGKIRCDTAHALAMTMARALTGDPPACPSIEDSALALEVFYASKGHVEARVSGAGATITIEEGEPYHLGTVAITDPEGALADPGVFTLGTGAVFDRTAVRAGIATVTARYDDAGYGLATVTPLTHVHRETHQIDLEVAVTRNQRAVIGAVDVTGTHTRPAAEIVTQSGLNVGAVFSNRAVAAAKQKLAGFRSVAISPQLDDPIETATRVRIEIEVAE